MSDPAPPVRSSAPGSHARGRVLIMDDETPNRVILRRLLSAQGYEVVDAPDGARRPGPTVPSRCLAARRTGETPLSYTVAGLP